MDHLLAERVKEIMEEWGYSPSSFADTIDVPRPIISHILSGRNKPSLDVIQKILMRFSELNPWWLLTGTGEMKQLNLFSDAELEAVSIKKTEVQQSNTTAQAVKVNESPLPPVKVETTLKDQPPQAVSLPPVTPPVQEQPKAAAPAAVSMAQALSNGKTVEKMVVFYSDKTFAVYHPE